MINEVSILLDHGEMEKLCYIQYLAGSAKWKRRQDCGIGKPDFDKLFPKRFAITTYIKLIPVEYFSTRYNFLLNVLVHSDKNKKS